MLEIYARDGHGIETIVATYKTYEEFFDNRRPREEDLKAFGYTTADRTVANGLFYSRLERTLSNAWAWKWSWNTVSRYCYLMYDYDKFITPDNLVGKYRDWLNNRKPYRYHYNYRSGAYQYGRTLKINNEVRQYYANDDEDAPRIRAKRSPSRLPDAWDRSFYPSEKCWKTQSKRKHQWK